MNYNIDTEEGMANAVRWMEQTLDTPPKRSFGGFPEQLQPTSSTKVIGLLPGLEWTNLQIGYFYTWALP